MKKFISIILCLAVISVAVFNTNIFASSDTASSVNGGDFLLKNDMGLYTDDADLNTYWKSNNTAATLFLEKDTSKVYGASGSSLKCQYDLSENGSTSFNFYLNDRIYNEDEQGNPLGYESRLGFWIYTDSYINSFYIQARDSSASGTQIKTENITLEAGEHFLSYEWTDFNNIESTVLESVYQLQFFVTPSTESGNIWIDHIGFFVDNSGDNSHADGFYEISTDAESWTNKNAVNGALEVVEDGFYHGKTTNAENNTASLKLTYNSLTDTEKANFYYNSDLKINKNSLTEGEVSDNLYGEDTVLAFWVRSDRSLILELNYSDKDIHNNNFYSEKFSTELKIGENLVKVPLKELVGSNEAAYYRVYQLQFWLANTTASEVGGNVYFDAFGFYNSNADNELNAMLNNLDASNITNADQVYDTVAFYNGLSDEDRSCITARTLYAYNKSLYEYAKISPKVEMPDILADDSIYDDGTLRFDIVVNDNGNEGYTLEEIGAVAHRKALVQHQYELSADTELASVSSIQVNSVQESYRKTVILKCFEGYSEEDYNGYLQTDYIVRPYAVYSDANGQSYTVYGDVCNLHSNGIKSDKENANKAFDGDSSTEWSVSEAGNYSLIHQFDEAVTFDSIVFNEKSQGKYSYTSDDGETVQTTNEVYGISDFSVETSDDGLVWKEIYRQDEMGYRTSLLDKEYTASFVKVNVTTDMSAGIDEITFKMQQQFETNFRNVSYLRMSEDIEKYSGNLQSLTDIILIDYGSWNSKGEFSFYNDDGADSLNQRIDEIKAIAPDIKIWYSLREYTEDDTVSKSDVFNENTDVANLIDTCVGLCDTYGLHGIDIDFEYPSGNEQLANYNSFLISLGTKLHQSGYELSVATSSYIDHSASSEYIDYVNLMVYSRPKIDRFSRHDSYNAIYGQIEEIMNNGFSAEQIVLGIGYYGKSANDNTSLPYRYLANRYYTLFLKDTNRYGSDWYCSGVSAVRDKTLLALNKGLNGVFSWSVTTDLPIESEYSLSGSVKDVLDKFLIGN